MRVLFLDEVHPILEEKLLLHGAQCVHDYTSDYKYVCSTISGYDGLVIRSRLPINKELLDQSRQLKFIARSGAGMENIDVEYAKSKGIKCFHAPEGNRDAVAEHAIGMLLCMMNNMLQGDSEIRSGIWRREANRGEELKGKTVGIVGYGFMGEAFAKRLAGFDVDVIAYDKFKSGFGSNSVKEVDEDELKEQADIISFHIPLNDENQYLINSSYLESFSKPIYVLNTSRGKILNTKDLLVALDNGNVKGACLDVLEYESSSFTSVFDSKDEVLDKLLSSKKVILSPHVAGWTNESYEKLSSVLYEKIEKDILKG